MEIKGGIAKNERKKAKIGFSHCQKGEPANLLSRGSSTGANLEEQTADQPSLNLTLGKAFLSAHDPKLQKRTWTDVMEEFASRGKPQTQERKRRLITTKPFQLLQGKKLVETTSDDLLAVMSNCSEDNRE